MPPWLDVHPRRRSFDPAIVGAALAVAFALWEMPFSSFMADDFIQLGILERVLPISGVVPFGLYTFAGSPQDIQSLKDAGAIPWFFDPGFRMAFFRPLSSASLVLDHALFGLHPIGYHIHVTLWSLVLVVCVAKLYQLVLRPGATLALVLFTIASFHSWLCWTATRHIVLAAALGMLALYSHLQWREAGWRPGRILSVLGFALSLGASEAALGVIAYLFAYEACGARGSARSRVRATLPVVGLVAAYVLMYRLAGLGASIGSDYLDPLRSPYAYLTQIPGRVVFLIGAMLIGGHADLWVLRPDFRPAMILVAAAITLLGGLTLRATWSVASTAERRATGWLAVGAVLSSIPFAGSPMGSRCIIVPWIGGAAAVALILRCWWTTLRQRPGLSNRLVGAVCWGLAAIHLVLAPAQRLAGPPMLRQLMYRDVAQAMEDPLLSRARLSGRTLVLLNTPDLRIGLQGYFFRKLYRLPMPAAWRVLSWAPCAHRFRRTAVDTIEMELRGGELQAPYLARDQIVELADMRATVIDVGRYGPTRVAFRFDRSLDDPSLVFLMWKDGRLQAAAAPAVGATLDVAWDGAVRRW